MKNWVSFFKKQFNANIDFGAELEFYYGGNLQALKDALPDLEIVEEEGFHQYELKTPVFSCPENLIKFIELSKSRLLSLSMASNKYVNFDAKPNVKEPGSALHFHVRFYSLDSTIADYAIGGLCKFMLGSLVYFAPSEKSYKRFKYPDIHTPNTVSWGNSNNRTVAIRKFIKCCSLEHRLSGADCDVKKSLWAIMQSIVLGVEFELRPPDPIYGLANSGAYVSAAKVPMSLCEAMRYAAFGLVEDPKACVDQYCKFTKT